MQVGSIVHDLLHRYYMGESLPQDLEQYIQDKYPHNQGNESVLVAQEAYRLLLGYIEQYQEDPLTIISSEMKIEVDRQEPETGRWYTIYGIIDACARTKDNRLWRFEHKTASRIDTYYLSGLRSGLQGGIYHYLLNQTMPEPVVGTIYNMLVKTKIPQFQRMPVFMQQTLADRALQTFDGIARQIFQGDIFPDAGSCFSYNRECDYLPLCNIWKGEWTPQIQRIVDSFYEDYYPTSESAKEGGQEEQAS